MTTLFAARREDLTAVLGAHALEETVDAFAATVVRLKGPLHGTGTPKKGLKTKARHCTGARHAASREISRLGILLILSTTVDKAVDNPLGACGPKPYATGVPATETTPAKVAENA